MSVTTSRAPEFEALPPAPGHAGPRAARLLVFCDDYPRPGPGYGGGFVRSRLEAYLAQLPCEIVVVKLFKRNVPADDYELNGVTVKHLTRSQLPQFLKTCKPDVVLAHFIQSYLCRHLLDMTDAPLLVWVHGEEALSWTSRLFYLKTLGLAQLARYVIRNGIQLRAMRGLFRRANQSRRVEFVFVSEWMRQIAERDVAVALSTYHVIPNFIDSAHFHYVPKPAAYRRHVLLIRSFNTAKYANDWAAEAIHLLARRYRGFADMRFTIVGAGVLWEKLTSRLTYSNVTLINRMLDHREIKALHDKHGVFLCPTRQDAQGVSMCEAMASGLVPVSSDNTAIPEFVSENQGYLCKSPDEMADALEELAEGEDVFLRKSAAAAERAAEQTGVAATVSREIELIRRHVAESEPVPATAHNGSPHLDA